MTVGQGVYFEDVVEQWAKEIAAAEHSAILFFPFITLPAVKAVFAGKCPRKCRVYTRFEAAHFASGASSLKALKWLLEIGVQLFELPTLHAKLVIVPGKFASIGSQNLTRQGRQNREATVTFTSPKIVARIERQAKGGREHACEITREQIAELEAQLPALRERFVKATTAAKEIDQLLHRASLREAPERVQRGRRTKDVLMESEEREGGRVRSDDVESAGESNDDEPDDDLLWPPAKKDSPWEELPYDEERRAQAEWLAEEEDQHPESQRPLQERQRAFQRAIDNASKAEAVPAEVRTLRGNKTTLTALAERRLTTWVLDGASVVLKKYQRYVCLIDGEYKLGWARVIEKRISFVAEGVYCTEPVVLGGLPCQLRFEAEWDRGASLDRNLRIQVLSL